MQLLSGGFNPAEELFKSKWVHLLQIGLKVIAFGSFWDDVSWYHGIWSNKSPSARRSDGQVLQRSGVLPTKCRKIAQLGGGFNPFEKKKRISQLGNFPQVSGWKSKNKCHLKQPRLAKNQFCQLYCKTHTVSFKIKGFQRLIFLTWGCVRHAKTNWPEGEVTCCSCQMVYKSPHGNSNTR